MLSQADVALSRAKRQLLPGLAEECGCLEEYLGAVAAYGRNSPRLRKRRRNKKKNGAGEGSDYVENDDETTPDARLANAELSLVSLLADARRDLDLASSDRQRRLALRVARREADELVSAAVSGSSRLWGGVVLGIEREKREQRQRQRQPGGGGGWPAQNVGGVAGWRRSPSLSSIPASSSSSSSFSSSSSLPPSGAAIEGSWNYTPATTPRASASPPSSSSSPSSPPFSPRPPLPVAAASRSIFSRPTSPPSPSLPTSSLFSRSSAPAPLSGDVGGVGVEIAVVVVVGGGSRPAAFAFSAPSAALPQGFDPAAPLGGSDVVALFERGRAAADRRLEAAAVEAAGGPGRRADELVRALYKAYAAAADDDDGDFDAEDDESEEENEPKEEEEKAPEAPLPTATASAPSPLTPPPLPRVSVGRKEKEKGRGEEGEKQKTSSSSSPRSSSSLSLAAAMLSKLDVAATEPGRPRAFREEREGSEGGGDERGKVPEGEEEGEPL